MSLFQNKAVVFILRQIRDIVIAFAIGATITCFFQGKALFATLSIFIYGSLKGFIICITVWKGCMFLGRYVNTVFPWNKNQYTALAANITTVILYIAIVITVINILFYKYMYYVPVKEEFNRILFHIVVETGISVMITTLFYLQKFFMYWRTSAVNEEKYKQEAISLQYETLKSYVNPHFLFNSLSVLSSLIEKDTAKSQAFIRQLSDIYRYVLEQKDKEMVRLNTELDFAQSFIELYKVRHGEHLRVEVSVNDRSGFIIPLSMQILLENAFKHNIISSDQPLDVFINRENDYIVVRNKHQERKTLTNSNGFGLETLKRRFAFYTLKPLIIESENGWFTVKIPVMQFNQA